MGIDFIMRVLVIERKVAKRYQSEDSDDTSNSNNETEEDQDAEQGATQSSNEQTPLLGKLVDDQEYKLSDDQPKIFRIVRILPCMAHPGLLMAFVLALVQALILGGFDATVANVARELFGFDSLKAGLLFLPLGVVDLIFGPIAGWLVDRYGTKLVAVLSFAYATPMFVLLRLPHEGGTDQAVLYGGLLALVGIGLAGIGAPSIVEAGAVVDKYHKANPKFFGENGPYAQLYGMSSAMFNLGLTVGPELAGELKEAIGYGNMNIVIAAICAVTAILSFLFIGGKPEGLTKDKHSWVARVRQFR